MFYQFYELNHARCSPSAPTPMRSDCSTPIRSTHFRIRTWGRSVAATAELFERTTRRYGKPAFGIDHDHGRLEKRRRHRKIVWSRPFCNLDPVRARPAGRPPARPQTADRGADVGPLCDAAARHGRGACCPMPTSTSPTGSMRAWCRSRTGSFDLDDYIDYIIDMLHRARARHACHGGVPALGAGACGRRADGGARRPFVPGDHDADGRADRHPPQPDRGQPPGRGEGHRLVPRQCHHAGAVAGAGLHARRLSGLPAAVRAS